MTGWSWLVGDLSTGRVATTLPVVDGSWSQVMDDAGQFSVTVDLADPGVVELNPRAVAGPCRCFLVLAYTDPAGIEYLIDGGPIWTHSYDVASKQLTVGAAGMWSYYDHRFVLPVLDAGQSAARARTVYSNVSLATVATRLVQLAHSHTGGKVPVDFPDEVPGTSQRTYAGFNFATVGQALRDLTQGDGGPEIQFLPHRRHDNSRFVQWSMRIGTPSRPLLTQAGPDWAWDFTVPYSPVSGMSVTVDGSGMAQRAWVQGAGTGRSTLFARRDNTTLEDFGFPLLEKLDSDHAGESDASNRDVLDAYAAIDAEADALPAETWSATVSRDDSPNVAQYQVGDWCRFSLPLNDAYLTDRVLRGRVTGKSGDQSTSVSLQIQPEVS